jgi:DnaJ family protein A protein 2
MNLFKNYYQVLEVSSASSEKEIKKSYYNLSKVHHPDKGGDSELFNEICEAYEILIGEKRAEYDTKSKWGALYDEGTEFLNYEFNNLAKTWDEKKLEDWKSQNQLNVVVYVDSDFSGSIKYERWVICKTCGGDGKDNSSKIEIRDENGNLLKLFDGDDGCDFCEGTGKNWKNENCTFCGGKGQVGMADCKTCKGERRILGNQKLSSIKIPQNEKAFRVEGMGHFSKFEVGKVGDLWIVKKN